MSSSIVPQRICNVCKQSHPLTPEFWHKNSSHKSGFCHTCKVCARAKARQWNADNQEYVSQRSAAYYQSNRERIKKASNQRYHQSGEARLQRHRDYYQRNRDKVLNTNRAWAEANPDKSSEIKRRYVTNHPVKRRESARLWHHNNPEKSREVRHRRRAREIAAEGSFTAADIRLQYRSQRGKCWHCGKPVGDDYHVDHLRPLDKGGSNDPRNLVISCAPCNLSKGNKQTWEWNGKLF